MLIRLRSIRSQSGLRAASARRNRVEGADFEVEGGVSSEILLVEDRDSLRQMLRLALQAGGHVCSRPRDEAQASELLQRHRPALVLTDLKLPRGDGFGVLRAARQMRPRDARHPADRVRRRARRRARDARGRARFPRQADRSRSPAADRRRAPRAAASRHREPAAAGRAGAPPRRAAHHRRARGDPRGAGVAHARRRRPTPRCCCAARAAPARSCSRARSTR